jgi:hypothetical protein
MLYLPTLMMTCFARRCAASGLLTTTVCCGFPCAVEVDRPDLTGYGWRCAIEVGGHRPFLRAGLQNMKSKKILELLRVFVG